MSGNPCGHYHLRAYWTIRDKVAACAKSANQKTNANVMRVVRAYRRRSQREDALDTLPARELGYAHPRYGSLDIQKAEGG